MKVFAFHGLFLLFFSIFCNGLSKDASRPAVVNIGAFFTFDSTIGRVAKIAIQEAVNDVNSNSTILHDTRLNILMQNTNCSGFIGMVQALQFMEMDVVAVIGPQSSAAAHITSFIASELQVPLLSFSATDPTLTPLGFPFFIRTTHSDVYQMTAIAEIIEYYAWKQVIAIFVDDDNGRNGVLALDGALTERRCRISYKVGIRPGSIVSWSEIMDILVKVSLLESRVIVLHVNPDSGFTIFRVAEYLQMMGNGYVWISTDWLSSILDSSAHLPDELMDIMQGVVVLRQHTPDSTRKGAFFSRWRNLTGVSFGLNSYGLFAYDSVWLVAHAIDAYLNQGGVISFSNISSLLYLKDNSLHLEAMHIFDGGQILLNNILHNDLVGLTGPLKFDSDRSLFHPAYDVINVIGTGYRQIGYWSNYSGLSTVPPEKLYASPPNRSSANQHLYSPFWPGGTTSVPRGWAFPNSGRELKIGVPIRVSFQEFVSPVQGSNSMFKGFCIDVFTAAADLLPYAVPYVFVGYGDGHKNPNYTDLVNMVTSGNFDAAIGDIAIVTSRTRMVDFTQPYAVSGLVVVAPFKKLNSGAWAFLRPFTPPTWGVIVALFIIIGVVVWLLEHRINDDFRGCPTQQIITILWFSFSTLTFSHRENTLSTLGRMVLLIWLFVVLILTSSYTASLTSILTVQQLSSPIQGIDTLRVGNERIGYQVGSFAEQYLSKELNISLSRLFALDSPEEYAAALLNGYVDAVVDELSYVELFLASHCDFRIVGQEFTRSGWGFAFPRGSPLAIDMSTAILKLSEDGELQRIHDKWLTGSTCSVDTTEIESSQLHLKSFLGLFLICGIACVCALCIYFVRLCHKFHRITRAQPTQEDQGSSHSRCDLHTLVSLFDERKDLSKSSKRRRQGEGSLSDDDEDEVGRKLERKRGDPLNRA
ncbi:hypothetical protein Nepgr_006524 [Nepenthes gracilis]|uniref:Glutamate receptor n=1 Tax=Nepenthes gracilis TaxID=150966 RepID=A0AAD3S562_NEPGR|nr:hypothetical protein Nepgr_006524 [Nepenthes gracilis]